MTKFLANVIQSIKFDSLHRLQFDATFLESGKPSSIEAFKISRRVIQSFHPTKDKERFEIYCRYDTSISCRHF